MNIDKNKYRVNFFNSAQIERLSTTIKKDIAQCFTTVFNQPPWNEQWTQQKAMREINAGLTKKNYGDPILTVLYEEEKIVGFACCTLCSYPQINRSFLPKDLPPKEKTKGAETIKYLVQKFFKREKILFFKEIAILPAHTGKWAPHLVIPLFTEALQQEIKDLFYWTHLKSRSFTLGLGVRWLPFYFFQDPKNYILMSGDIKKSMEEIEIMARGDYTRHEENIKIFYHQ